ncbi:MAG: hypothetical protein D6705_17055 [Deltaproteobacteria bacterium]|nr:MAG: hypothetical protein D6705_17055 [Deltaproteobacteria bacterium]
MIALIFTRKLRGMREEHQSDDDCALPPLTGLLREMGATLDECRCSIAEIMRRTAARFDVDADFRSLTVCARPDAALVLVALKGRGDFGQLNDRRVVLAYIDIPATGDGASLPTGFYVLRTVVDPDSGATQVAFDDQGGSTVATFPAAIRLVGSGSPQPALDADCDVEGDISDGKACVVAQCCVIGVCLEVDVCLTWGNGSPTERVAPKHGRLSRSQGPSDR